MKSKSQSPTGLETLCKLENGVKTESKYKYIVRTIELDDSPGKVVGEFNSLKKIMEFADKQGWKLKSTDNLFGGYFRNEEGDAWEVDIVSQSPTG